MKNNNNINTVELSAIPAIANLSADYKAVAAAKEKYDTTKRTIVKQLAAALADIPAEAPVLNKDLARAAGMTPLHFANIVDAQHQLGVNSTTVTVTRRFVEVDEDGKPIEGAPITEKTSSLVAYYGKGRRW